jgi:putative aldouronate transport system permease protein
VKTNAVKQNSRIREGSMIATVVMYILAGIFAFICIYPMYYVLILSLSDPSYAITMQVFLFPKGLNIDSYKILAMDPQIWSYYRNTIMYVFGYTGLMLVTCTLGAFPLTFKGLPGRKIVNTYLLINMFFSVGLIPTFLLVLRLGLYDTPWALILQSGFSVWNIILVKSYFSTVPETLREAARIDGANVYQILFKIYLPLSVPIMAVIAVYTVVVAWNAWFNAMIYLPHIKWQPLQLYLRRMLILLQSPGEILDEAAAEAFIKMQLTYAQLKYAMIVFTSLPVLFSYPFFQKYFMKGIMLGSLKE